jgi:Ca2+-binding RTX toxin-like protein
MFRDWLRSLRVVSGFSAPSRKRLRRSGASRLSRALREGQSLETRQVLSAFAVGGEILVNTTTAGIQQTGLPAPSATNPSDNSQAVALDGDGDYVVVWQGETSPGSGIFNVFGRQFSANGTPSVNGQFQINTTAATAELNMSKPSVAMDSTGNFIVTWARGNGVSSDDIYARRFNASGTPVAAEFRVSQDPVVTATTLENKPTVAMSSLTGEFVIAWESNQVLAAASSTSNNIFARVYNSSGVHKGDQFVVNSTLPDRQRNASVAMDGSGRFVIAWDSVTASGGVSQDGDDFGVYARRFLSTGAAIGDEFRVNSATTGEQRSPSVAMDESGDFVIVWHDNPSGVAASAEVYGRRYTSNFVDAVLPPLTLISPFLVTSGTTTGAQRNAAVAMDADGDFVVTWESNEFGNYEVYRKSFTELGVAVGPESVVNTFITGDQTNSAVSMDAAGDFVVVWTSAAQPLQDNSLEGVYSQRYHENRPPSAVQLTVSSLTLTDTTDTTFRIKTADITVTDDGYGTNVLSIAGADASSFEIVGNALYLKAGVILNPISKPSYSVSVQVDDVTVGTTPDATAAFTLNVILANLAPTAVVLSSTVPTLEENTSTASRVRVADISVSDDGRGTNVLSLTGADAEAFEIVSGSLYVKSGVTLDFEAKSSYSVTVQVDDAAVGGNPDASTPFSLTLTNVNEAPTAVNLLNPVTTLVENTSTASRVRVADISVVDDALGTNVLSVTGGADAEFFEIVDGSLYVKSGVTLDFETKSSYSVTVQVDDSAVGGSPDASTPFSLTLTDVLLDGTALTDGFVLTYTGVAPTGTVSVTRVTAGITSILGTHPLSAPLTLQGVGPLDTIIIVGSAMNDVMEPLSTTSFLINGASLTLSGSVGVGAVTLDGAGGNDTYRFDTDNALGTVRLRETVGGGGVDLLDFSATTLRGVSVNLGRTSAQIVNSNLSLVLNSLSAFENVTGGSRNDSLTGNGIANLMLGGGGSDFISGEAGSDSLTGGSGDDNMVGGGGDDFLIGGSGGDNYHFDADLSLGSDVVEEGVDVGADLLNFRSTTTVGVTVDLSNRGLQVVNGNLSLTIPATLLSVSTIENVFGGSQSDLLTGNELGNSLYGSDGNDTMLGGGGSDFMVGGADNDTYHFDADSPLGSDTVADTSGTDVADFSLTTSLGVSLNLALSTTQVLNANLSLRIQAGTVLETVFGSAQNDVISGNDADNILVGNAGNDLLSGGLGRDILIGGLGADTLVGGAGDDLLIAGTTSFDLQVARLNLIRTEWISGNSFATRTANLRNGVVSPLTALKGPGIGQTVFTDASVDVLDGGADNDWGFKAIDDVFQLLVATEELDVL